MVMNSFEKTNFMQPMGRPKHCTQGALLYVLLSFAEGGVGRTFFIFPWFPKWSHYVPFKFSPMGSHQVPNMFLKFSMHSPKCSP
jgi:hypothetical protein